MFDSKMEGYCMRKLLATLATTTALFAAAGTFAATYEAWGHTFDYDSFQPRMLDVAVGTERATGHKMNLVKLKNGHMMALVPADRYVALMTTPTDDMLP